MKYFWLYLLFALAVLDATLTYAQSKAVYNNLGTGYYGMLSDNWNCDAVLKADEKRKDIKLSVLWNTFGNNTACLAKYLSTKSVSSLEIHLINEVCVRHNSCGSYEFLSGLTASQYNSLLISKDSSLVTKLQNYISKPSAFITSALSSSTQCYINPGLESNLTNKAAKNLIEIVKPYFPQCKIVWNPVWSPGKKITPIEGTVLEQHYRGLSYTMPSPCIFNLDGEDISYPSRPAILPQNISSSDLKVIAQNFKNCDLNFFWIAEYNGLTSGSVLDPRVRTAFPSTAIAELVVSSISEFQSK
jgi:hypothetical protein